MASKKQRNKTWLLATAKAVASELKRVADGTPLRVRMPTRSGLAETNGWYVTIGNLGKGRPSLEVWLDHFTGHKDRKLQACFGGTRKQLSILTARVSRELCPVRTITQEDTVDKGHLVLATPLPRDEFNRPILEKHPYDETYFGVYDLTKQSPHGTSPHFLAQAVSFFESVARSLPHARAEDEQRDVYPRSENRKPVASHLRRERSAYLAAQCKIRDEYVCQVCGLRFRDRYGTLGEEFAEAHHRVALGTLRDNVKTRVEDLTTVCANCHRMLHRMDGKSDDVVKLRAIVKRHRKSGK